MHGAEIYKYKNEKEIIDYSSNINFLGPPKGLKEYLFENFSLVEKYPDIKYRRAKKEVAKYLNTSEENVILGNGSVEIQDMAINLFKTIIIFNPSFLEYERLAKIHGKNIINIYSEDLKFRPSLLDGLDKLENSALILANPNNPTGFSFSREEFIEILEKTKKLGISLILDEAFYEYGKFNYSSVDFIDEYELIVLRAATKFFALPGIRLGYGAAKKEIIQKIESSMLPWGLNTFADLATSYIFKDKNYIKKSIDELYKSREIFERNLKTIKIKVFPTASNYFLIKLQENSENLFNFLLKRNFLIRQADGFRGLDKTYVRINIKDVDNNNLFFENIKEYINEK